ncbi:SprT family zinc-dependent metalloprotease [Herbivorax sp. ANBcel31]|uniref:M48 family metallopeptidase n=1 Tax=Herbivorax sp. ANBcel31 TaxID=3069754 RepID=UPI0027B60F5F|nr:SprT family zinc-dependent metalloprotease [Herbivorax sp. ANBcel31]MDQ2085427.1 SprT family zinc-dependent metalloprotease [Herbivorax sp. ANBcel31]
MQSCVKFGTRIIKYDVSHKDRKTMEISVEPPDKVFVIAPCGTDEKIIQKKVKSKGSWIVQKLFTFKSMEYRKIQREFVNGESFMYLGRNYSLQIHINDKIKNADVKLYRGKFYVTLQKKDEKLIKNAMKNWYREKTSEKVMERIKYYEHFFRKKTTGVKVRDQQKRWASCTSTNELLFNWRCVMAPSHVLDYIVVHEMCHMYYKNHSNEFWDMISNVLHDYERRKEWLKNYGVRMDL